MHITDKLKYAICFLLSLLWDWGGLVIGLVYIFKTIKDKRGKTAALIAGLILNIFLCTPFIYPLINRQIEAYLYNKVPELAVIDGFLRNEYPNRDFGVEIKWNQTNVLNESGTATTKTKTVIISFKTLKSPDQEVVSPETKEIARKVCSKLSDEHVVVKIRAEKTSTILYVISLNTFFSIDGTCREWLANEITEPR